MYLLHAAHFEIFFVPHVFLPTGGGQKIRDSRSGKRQALEETGKRA
jgi:hypothetical protein